MKRLLILCAGTLCLQTAFTQDTFPLPDLPTLKQSIDNYYNSLTEAQSEELRAERKNRWLHYVPSPGYSPFAGGFTLSLNLAAPLTEIKLAEQSKQKLQTIRRINELQAGVLKSEITLQHRALQRAIQEYHAKDSLSQLKQKAFNLYTSQYARNELTPSEFLSRQQDYEAFKVQRLAEANTIHHHIGEILIKAKAAIAANE